MAVEFPEGTEGSAEAVDFIGGGAVRVPVVGFRVLPKRDDQLIDAEFRSAGLLGQSLAACVLFADEPVVLGLALRGAKFPQIKIPAVKADNGLPAGPVQAV